MSSRPESESHGALLAAMRENSGRGLALHQAIADRFNLNATDLKCLDLARDEVDLTAGRVAKATGLSTSAVTAVLDRLEQRGFIERRRDPADRRKVVVVSTGRHETETAAIFATMGERLTRILADYDDEQLAFMCEFIHRITDTVRDLTVEVTNGNHGS